MNSSPVHNALLLEDDVEDRLAVRTQLQILGLTVYDTGSPREAMALFQHRQYVLVIIHLGNEPLAALAICRLIRSESVVPILMLTKRTEEVDEEMCIEAGADDYITKPIDNRILHSRVIQQMKRADNHLVSAESILTWGSTELDLTQHMLRINGNEVGLTTSEFLFLQLLMEQPQRVFTRAQILHAIGVMNGHGSDHIVHSHASRLRRKIQLAGGPDLVNSIRGVGYRLTSSKPKQFT